MEEYQDFQSEIFCLTVPNISVGQSFTLAIISGIEKVWIREGGAYQDFPSKFFCLTVPQNFRRGSLYCCKNFRFRKKLDKRGGVPRFYVEKFLSHRRKISVGESFTVAIISGIEKFR